ncbi:DUF4429 domain-containing protein [Streptomyces pactum]|uniref:DUF4429 domain-containing protein n=1 Tax=Streptomyces pactum TaxID=68249 RepID=A0ABS0NHH6_9ACTN|nr:DUF4429 domain-containing protein [Streptomyces pactum]MBH5334650.1 DUF4429 domain-containing protein [Streptomyces pactum]
MGDVLAGFHTVWEFDTDSVLIRFERGIRTPKLLQTLGERRVPYEAIAGVELSPGRRGTVVLRAVPRPGADPLMDVADGQLKEGCDPYRMVLPVQRERLAEYYAEEIRAVLDPLADQPAEEQLVAAPAPPLAFKAYDGKASFDGTAVTFRWSRTGASSAKWKAGDQRFPVAELCGVEWRSPESLQGHLRLDRAAGPQAASSPRTPVDQDPAAVVFGMGYGLVHESLPFAAAVLEAVRAAGRTAPALTPEPPPVRVAVAPRSGPAEIADRIRQLGELHTAGLLTDDEFSAKKAQLLAEL